MSGYRTLPKNIAAAILELKQLVPEAELFAGVDEAAPLTTRYGADSAVFDVPKEATVLYSRKGELEDVYLPPDKKPQKETRIPITIATVPTTLSDNIRAFAVKVGENTHVTFNLQSGTVTVDGEIDHYWLQTAQGLAGRYGLHFSASEEETHIVEDDARAFALRRFLQP